MRCESCGGRLLVTHTYVASNLCKTSRLTCEGCHLIYTKIAHVERCNGRGEGAYAVAQKLRRKTDGQEGIE